VAGRGGVSFNGRIAGDPLMSSLAAAAHAYAPANDADEDLMRRFGTRMVFADGEDIFAQDEPAELLYRLVAGTVRTTRLARDGRRQIGDFHQPGDLFGLEQSPLHRFSAEALGDCEVLVARRRAMVQSAGRQAFDRFMAEALAEALDRAQDHLILVGRRTALAKVARLLLNVAGRQQGPAFVLPMGRQDMADYLDLTIETVSRMVTQLQSAGSCRFVGRRTYLIKNPERLEAAAD
jgi:CRP/FNR family nitrogen fixation transcriptional regulator